jgi:N-acetylglucosaminyl-diphospho-decaprenol L-rhamnosyltransferase
MSDPSWLQQPVRLQIVTVNYNSAHLVIDCLQSLAAEVSTFPGGARVVVVDNASPDGLGQTIATAIAANGWGEWATFLPAEKNGGFSYGNNTAIRPALASDHPPEYFLLLNPDTQVRPGALQALVSFMDNHPQAGISGSSFEEADGRPWPYAFRFPSALGELEGAMKFGPVSRLLAKWAVGRTMGDVEEQIDWLPGASMMIRRGVFEAIGLMDEDYFLYYEETDFCLQSQRAGWECWYVPQSRVMHILGQSTGVTDTKAPPRRLPQYWFDSRRRFFVKNYGTVYTALADLLWIVGSIFWLLRCALTGKPNLDPPQMFSDFVRNSVWWPRNWNSLAPAPRLTPGT